MIRTLAGIVTTMTLAGSVPLDTGATFDLGRRHATLEKLDSLPYVESEYTKRFKYDVYGNPKLVELRRRYELDDVIASGKDEFDRQVLLMDWTHHRFKRFGRPEPKPQGGALEVLEGIEKDKAYFCQQYAQVLLSAAASFGWIDRMLAIRRHQDSPKDEGGSEHSITEIWSNQYRKWVMLDPTANMYLEKDGVPLDAYQIRQEWFYRDGKDLTFVIGKERKRYHKADLPISIDRVGTKQLMVAEHELDKYGFIGYVPNTNLMDEYGDYGGMYLVKDKLCEGTKWHTRVVPPDPARDLYFPLGQASVELAAEGGKLRVALRTMTPNFDKYLVRVDGGRWRPSADHFVWNAHAGSNRLEVKAVNRFGVDGPVSTADVALAR
jgi:hypothetical protein